MPRNIYFRFTALWLCAAWLLAACGATPTESAAPIEAEAPAHTQTAAPAPTATTPPSETSAPFELASSGFVEGEVIPARFACTGEDLSPELTWGSPPEGTVTLALLFDDPDGFDWVHWLTYNIPADAGGLPEGITDDPELPDGSLQGQTSWGTVGYRGPCPPAGTPHTYVFTLYALDTELALEAGADVDTFKLAIDGHVLAEIQYTGEFTR
jgi:hypothetical protein